ncbi:hypothetical protein V6Z11_A13G239400 [Gossypium hirsutum]
MALRWCPFCSLISFPVRWSANFGLGILSTFDADEDDGFLWLTCEVTSTGLFVGPWREVYGVVLACVRERAWRGCVLAFGGTWERTLGFL